MTKKNAFIIAQRNKRIGERKERQEKVTRAFVQKMSKKEKRDYLIGTGVFKENAVYDMNEEQLNELTTQGLLLKTFYHT